MLVAPLRGEDVTAVAQGRAADVAAKKQLRAALALAMPIQGPSVRLSVLREDGSERHGAIGRHAGEQLQLRDQRAGERIRRIGEPGGRLADARNEPPRVCVRRPRSDEREHRGQRGSHQPAGHPPSILSLQGRTPSSPPRFRPRRPISQIGDARAAKLPSRR